MGVLEVRLSNTLMAVRSCDFFAISTFSSCPVFSLGKKVFQVKKYVCLKKTFPLFLAKIYYT